MNDCPVQFEAAYIKPYASGELAKRAERALDLPLVYNTSACDCLESRSLLDGIIDIYMPDYKIGDAEIAHTYLKARDYPERARVALKEMHRQVGCLVLSENGLARQGVLVRHLVMPAGKAGTKEIMQFLAGELSVDTYVNIMGQYRPAARVSSKDYPEINRTVTAAEMEDAYAGAHRAGLHRFDRRALPRFI
jgi:putative pyruvate formate lyase activating enzyme